MLGKIEAGIKASATLRREENSAGLKIGHYIRRRERGGIKPPLQDSDGV